MSFIEILTDWMTPSYEKGGNVNKGKEWCVEYLPSNEDEYKIEKGFFSKAEAERWVKGENLYNRTDEINIRPLNESIKKKKIPEKGTPEWHQLQIAKSTIKMSPAGAEIMGGMTMEEAKKVLDKYGIKYDKE